MTIGLFTASRLPEALEYLQAEGYVILENLLAESQLVALREQVATVLEAESSNPPDPGPASSALADDDLRAYFIEHYSSVQQSWNACCDSFAGHAVSSSTHLGLCLSAR